MFKSRRFFKREHLESEGDGIKRASQEVRKE